MGEEEGEEFLGTGTRYKGFSREGSWGITRLGRDLREKKRESRKSEIEIIPCKVLFSRSERDRAWVVEKGGRRKEKKRKRRKTIPSIFLLFFLVGVILFFRFQSSFFAFYTRGGEGFKGDDKIN